MPAHDCTDCWARFYKITTRQYKGERQCSSRLICYIPHEHFLKRKMNSEQQPSKHTETHSSIRRPFSFSVFLCCYFFLAILVGSEGQDRKLLCGSNILLMQWCHLDKYFCFCNRMFCHSAPSAPPKSILGISPTQRSRFREGTWGREEWEKFCCANGNACTDSMH